MPIIESTCLRCGIKFKHEKKYDRVRKYCGRVCSGNLPNRHKKICRICSKEFWVKNSNIRLKSCSHSCANKLTPEEEFESLKKRFNKFVIKNNQGCWGWSGAVNESGYGLINYQKFSDRAHRISWLIHNGQIPDGLLVCHTCDNRVCTKITEEDPHLFLGTHKSNAEDKVKKGRQWFAIGENVNTSKLTNDQVRLIKKSLQQGQKISVLAQKFSVSLNSIYGIAKNKFWKHVKIEE